jgi:uncharacterized protein (DUF1501 family)
LVVLELVGGNDGLATVIPTDSAHYPKLRPNLQVVRRGAHALGDGTALHPELRQLQRLVRDGVAMVVHGVGYPGADRSHFRSRDIWHVADPAHRRVAAGTTGWLGRAADCLSAAVEGVPAAAIGGLEVPLALRARATRVPSVRRLEDFRWNGGDGLAVPAAAPLRAVLAAAPPDGRPLHEFVAATRAQAVTLGDRLGAALARYTPRADYPATALGRDLGLAARMCVAGFGTRLLHVACGGFDTHARQLPTHAALLAQLDAALAAFVADLTGHGRADQTCVFVHSEFGRRAAENGSLGTDHGAGAPAFVLLGGCRGGTLGAVPDLGDLDDGDVRSTLDFRGLYADMLTWLGVAATDVLGFAPTPVGLFGD